MSKKNVLSFKEAIRGACICADNAHKLAQDARRLYSRRRYSTATAIAISSLEELGKVIVLIWTAAFVNNKVKIEWGTFWKGWKNHKLKQQSATFLDMGLYGKDAVDLAMRTIIFEDLNQIREQCLYVDFKDNKWLIPKEIQRDWTVELLEAAESTSSEIIKEFNFRRFDLIINDLKKIKIPITKVSIEDNPILANLQDGFKEIETRIERLNTRIAKYSPIYGS